MSERCVPTEIRLHSVSNELELAWFGYSPVRLSGEQLRRACRCADCLSSAAAGESPALLPDALRIVSVTGAGAYGIQLVFQDGHDRGIYPWSYLSELSESGASGSA